MRSKNRDSDASTNFGWGCPEHLGGCPTQHWGCPGTPKSIQIDTHVTLLLVDQTENRPDKENKLKQTGSCARRPQNSLQKKQHCQQMTKKNWLKSYLFPGMSARKAFEPQDGQKTGNFFRCRWHRAIVVA